MENCAFVRASVPVTRISKGLELGMVRCKSFPHNLNWLLEHDDHECPHKVASISLFFRFDGRIVKQLDLLIAFVRQQSAQFSNVLVRAGDVQRSEVRVEWLIT